ncbi:MAG: head GIN domain-containing protein [Pontixanthobacter sp.]
MLNHLFKKIAPVAAMAIGLALSGCNIDMSINGEKGVPLAELDQSGDPPTGVALLGPDVVIISEGKKLAITVEGEDKAVEAMRFTLEDGTLGIMRDSDVWNGKAKATVRVTMPAPEDLNMAGSGRIEAATMAKKANINIAGSGVIEVTALAADSLEVAMAGSGSVKASGSAKALEVSVMGSGETDLSGLTTEGAEVNIAGSGSVAFASDGKVEVNMAGSGNVTVTGEASCEVNSMGSGKVTCKSGTPQAATEPAE